MLSLHQQGRCSSCSAAHCGTQKCTDSVLSAAADYFGSQLLWACVADGDLPASLPGPNPLERIQNVGVLLIRVDCPCLESPVPPELIVDAAHWCLVTLMLPESLRATTFSDLQGLLKDILLETSPGSRVGYESSCLEQWGHIACDDIGGGAHFLLQCVLAVDTDISNSPQAAVPAWCPVAVTSCIFRSCSAMVL